MGNGKRVWGEFIMEQIIIEQGYSFIAIQEAIQAIPALVSVNPSLIFLDIGMPIINGYEICAQIKKVSQWRDGSCQNQSKNLYLF